MLFVLVDLQRAQFRDIFFRRETGVTAVGQHDDANDNENDPEDPAGLHEIEPRLERTSARDQIDDQDDDRNDEQQMDELAAKMTHEAEKPENQQNYKDGPEHKVSFLVEVYSASCAEVGVRL
jgi:hypothetical protein